MSNEDQPILKCKTCRYCVGGGAGSSRGRIYDQKNAEMVSAER